MSTARSSIVPPALGVALLLVPAAAAGQVWEDVKEEAEEAAKEETVAEVEEFVRNAVHCVFDDLDCIREARSEGDDVVLTDQGGEVIYDEGGEPVTDPSGLPPERRRSLPDTAAAGPAPDYDFRRGERLLVLEDYADDVPGDFPRGLRFVRGNMEVAEWPDRRTLEITAPSAFQLTLPEPLPDRFTLEFPVRLDWGQTELWVVPGVPEDLDVRAHPGHAVKVDVAGTGLEAMDLDGVGSALSRAREELRGSFGTVRVMADGDYVKVYVGRRRVANVPRAVFPREDVLFFAADGVKPKHPLHVGPIRVSAGGRDLYGAIEAEGRVAVQDIRFDTNSARVRPESRPVLAEIAAMLEDHPDLRLMIEGHTDDQGGIDHNMRLSRERAASVRAFLVEEFGIDGARLKTLGLGPTRPVASNETAQGRQRNRRVELVRLEP